MKASIIAMTLLLAGAFSLPANADDYWFSVNTPAVQLSAGHHDHDCRPGSHRVERCPYCHRPAPLPPGHRHDKKAWKRYEKEMKAYEKHMKKCAKHGHGHGHHPRPGHNHGHSAPRPGSR